jgi:hypothetical protein
MHDLTRADIEDHEDVHDTKGRCDGHEEVACERGVGMIAHEGAPPLRRRPTARAAGRGQEAWPEPPMRVGDSDQCGVPEPPTWIGPATPGERWGRDGSQSGSQNQDHAAGEFQARGLPMRDLGREKQLHRFTEVPRRNSAFDRGFRLLSTLRDQRKHKVLWFA